MSASKSSYGPGCLNFERSEVNLDLVKAMPEILIKSIFECILKVFRYFFE